MKKILFLVLFALIFGSISAGISEEWDKAKQVVSKAIEWLKSKGLYDNLLNLLLEGLKDKAQQFCERQLPSKVCSNIIEWLINAIRRELLD